MNIGTDTQINVYAIVNTKLVQFVKVNVYIKLFET